MIIIKLIGGLGNQLFQYAAGRRLAKFHNVELKLDTTGFKTYKLRRYALGHFNIEEIFASDQEIHNLKGRRRGLLNKIAQRYISLPGYSGRFYVRERSMRFDSRILRLSGEAYLDGYWQNENYFKDHAELIRQELEVKTPPTEKNLELLGQIKACESVFLHIRRGDYISDPTTARFYGSCALDYYKQCASLITYNVEQPYFYVFSDDPKWAINNLHLENPFTTVYHNGPDIDYEDLRLMSNCKHGIIANSTFSWWGAWLNRNPKKIICAPRQWAGNRDEFSEIVPESWLKI